MPKFPQRMHLFLYLPNSSTYQVTMQLGESVGIIMYQPSGQYMCGIFFSVSFRIGCWPLMVGARRYLDPLVVARVMQMIGDGDRLRVVARRLDMSPSVVNRLLRNYQETWEYTRRQGQDRSRMKPQYKTVFLYCWLSLRKHMSTARAMETEFRPATKVHLTVQTVRNKLHHDGTSSRLPAGGTVLITRHCTRSAIQFWSRAS